VVSASASVDAPLEPRDEVADQGAQTDHAERRAPVRQHDDSFQSPAHPPSQAPEIEEEAQMLLLSPYLEPFVLRALAVANDDQTLFERAVDGFTALGLDWHASQTPSLSPGRR
jgi:hypothetical protein